MIYSYFLEHIILPVADRINGTFFLRELKKYRKTVNLTKEELSILQKEKLKKILLHARSNSSFYSGVTTSEESDAETMLKTFPVLKKRIFRENLPDIVTKSNLDGLHVIRSSGSTGPPGKVYFDNTEISIGRAIQVLWWEWAGYKIGNSILQTGVNLKRSREKAIKDVLFKTTYIEALSHDENQILEILTKLEKHPIDHFVGYASSLYLFAKVAKANEIKDVRFISIISLGEKLFPNFRELIEDVFGCKVFDTYGASEGFRIASQCKEGNYHFMMPHLYIEIVDENDIEVNPGETGTILITDLDNYTTPMIRYELGDMAVKAVEQKCKCGMNLPMFGEVTGRSTEFLETPGKKFITVQTVVRVLKQFPMVEEFRLTQVEKNLFELEYTSKSELGVVENSIVEQFNTMFEEVLNFRFIKVDQVPKGPTGKFQLIRNKLSSTC